MKAPGLTLTEVAEQVRVAVRQMASTVQHRQTPAYYNQVLGRVCIAGGDCGPRLPAQPSEAERAWVQAKETTSIPALEVFIRRFSDTYYGDLARVRLAELVQAEVAKKKVEVETRTKAERQRLALLKGEQNRERAEAVVKKRADDARAEGEAERKRIVLLQQEQDKRVKADSAKQAGDAAKRTEEEARGKRAAEAKRLEPVSDGQYKGLLNCAQLAWTNAPLGTNRWT